MPSPLTFTKLVIASHNPGKLKEYKGIFEPHAVTVTSAGQLGLPEPEETGTTFAENALLKAKATADVTGQVALGDDGGLVIPALDGHPGIRSARWAAEMGGFDPAYEELEKRLRGLSHKAAFQLVLALYDPNTARGYTYSGECPGSLTFPAQGTAGFGYDRIFVPEGFDKTFGQLGPSVKRQISHRARALRSLLQDVFG